MSERDATPEACDGRGVWREPCIHFKGHTGQCSGSPDYPPAVPPSEPEAVHIGAGIHYAEGVQAERDRIIGIIEADYPDADVITDEGKYRITDLIESIRGAQG